MLILFEVNTPINLQIRTTKDYWNKIISFKHPAMSGREEAVKETLAYPMEIRKSRKDQNVRERGYSYMARIKVFFDKEGKTITVWFDDPQKEFICEETGEEVILTKDKEGKVIGFERLNFAFEETEAGFALEAVAV